MNMTNTGSSVPNLSRSNIHNAEVIMPYMEIINQFDDVVKPIFELIYESQEQASTLSQIRDALLPKLMSGKIRVPLEKKE
jgi:type I restriction enzyme S subunit